MLTKRRAHLVAGEVCGFASFLNGHAKLDDVEEELEKILILGVAALHRETEKRLSILQGQGRGERHPRSFAGGNHVEGVLRLIEHETLHPLAHAHAGSARQTNREPAAARRH